MTQFVVIAFAAALALCLAWFGWRKGGRAALLSWLPVLVSSLVVFGAAKLASVFPDRPGTVLLAGLSAAVAAYIVTYIFASRTKRRMRAKRRTEPSPPHLPVADRALGVVMGVFHAALICLAVAFLGSAVSFGITLASFREYRMPPAPGWIQPVREGFVDLADVADSAFFRFIPGVKQESRELVAFVKVMSAPRWKLHALGRRLEFPKLMEVPAMQTALADEEVLRILDDASRGSPIALRQAAKNEKIRAVIDSPKVREFIKDLRPTRMAAELDAIPDSMEQEIRVEMQNQ